MFLESVWGWVAPIVGVEPVEPVIEGIGRGEWIRTTDLLVPNQGYPAISLNTGRIFSCKTSI